MNDEEEEPSSEHGGDGNLEFHLNWGMGLVSGPHIVGSRMSFGVLWAGMPDLLYSVWSGFPPVPAHRQWLSMWGS